MSVWQILEIEPTSDTKSIKRAYAKKLKVTRPDEDPKGFQDLHWAYKTALQHAEWMASQEANDYQDDDANTEINSSSTQEQGQNHNQEQSEQLTSDQTIYISEPDAKNDQIEKSLYTQIEISPLFTQDHLHNEDQNQSDQLISDQTIYISETVTENHPIEKTDFDLQFVNQDDDQDHSPAINVFQQEGERLLDISKLLLASNGDQAKPESWSFIIESPFILEDHFNWRLGLEILQLIREHNLNHTAQIPKIVGQDALTYLDTIFNWNTNRQQILRVLGEEYQTWLDMIRDSQQADNWQDKIRGGKKLTLANQHTNTVKELTGDSIVAPPFRRFMAWLIDWVFIFFVIMLLKEDQADLSPLIATFVFPLLYFVFFESSQLQGTIGKRLLGLKVVKFNLEPLKITHSILRTICFLLYQTALAIAVVGISMSIPFATFIIVGIYAYSFSKDPSLFYDRITKTQVIKTRKPEYP